jgi:hypothetical protein
MLELRLVREKVDIRWPLLELQTKIKQKLIPSLKQT